ncbi:hypothetical protein GURKE_00870 [Brevundimonas phage vB_BpoS-Gurke]|uniref:Uncharacterized protein n=1 Tax=Brevundimonas phage vB_BpoS-Gurke TaxID=2948599 RepID=A0A9E7N1Q0_9CAUD|nr:hypothetical protein GURKE_00870 [Brevundimonas phage vB_BpoS-Gurke]
MRNLFNRLVLGAQGFFAGCLLVTMVLFLAAVFGAPIPDVRLVQLCGGGLLAAYMALFGNPKVVEDMLCDL